MGNKIALILFIIFLFYATSLHAEAVPLLNQAPVINTGKDASLNTEKLSLLKKLHTTSNDEKDRHLLEEQLQAVQEQLVNLQQSYEEELQRRKNAEKALVKMESQLSSTQIAEAEKSLAQEDTQKAEQIFDEVVDRQGKFVALAAFQSGKLAEGRVDYAKAMRQYTKAVTLEEDNPDYLLAAGKMALTTAAYSKAEDWFSRLLAIRERGKC